MAAAAAADAAELEDVRSGIGFRCGEVWAYMRFAASVASGDAIDGPPYAGGWPWPDGAKEALESDDDRLGFWGRKVRSLSVVAFCWLCFFDVLMPSKIWFATAIDIPQKSGTRCTQ